MKELLIIILLIACGIMLVRTYDELEEPRGSRDYRLAGFEAKSQH